MWRNINDILIGLAGLYFLLLMASGGDVIYYLELIVVLLFLMMGRISFKEGDK